MGIDKKARFAEGVSVDVPKYLEEHGNPEAAKAWTEMNEKYGDKLKGTGKTAAIDLHDTVMQIKKWMHPLDPAARPVIFSMLALKDIDDEVEGKTAVTWIKDFLDNHADKWLKETDKSDKQEVKYVIRDLKALIRGKKGAANSQGILPSIHSGDKVTIVDRFGREHTGKAVMRGPAGWVLNMGGPHGTPGIATNENIVRVKKVAEDSLGALTKLAKEFATREEYYKYMREHPNADRKKHTFKPAEHRPSSSDDTHSSTGMSPQNALKLYGITTDVTKKMKRYLGTPEGKKVRMELLKKNPTPSGYDDGVWGASLVGAAAEREWAEAKANDKKFMEESAGGMTKDHIHEATHSTTRERAQELYKYLKMRSSMVDGRGYPISKPAKEQWEAFSTEKKTKKTADVSSKVKAGTRVVVNGFPGARILYGKHPLPPDGTLGTVTPANVGGGMKTFVPGGGGLLFVKFDNGDFMGVQLQDVDLVNVETQMGKHSDLHELERMAGDFRIPSDDDGEPDPWLDFDEAHAETRKETTFEKIHGFFWGLHWVSPEESGPSPKQYQLVERAVRIFKECLKDPLLKDLVKHYLKTYDHLGGGYSAPNGIPTEFVIYQKTPVNTAPIEAAGWVVKTIGGGRIIYTHPGHTAIIMTSSVERFVAFSPDDKIRIQMPVDNIKRVANDPMEALERMAGSPEPDLGELDRMLADYQESGTQTDGDDRHPELDVGSLFPGIEERLASSGPIGKGKNGYIALYKGKKVEVNADSSLQARDEAAKYFKAKKPHEVEVVLAEKDGKPVKHDPLLASDSKTAALAMELRSLTPLEKSWAITHLKRHKGERLLGTPYKFGQRVIFQGKPWLVYDHDAEGSSSLLVLISPTGTEMARFVPLDLKEPEDPMADLAKLAGLAPSDDKFSRFEEGKAADPTKNMSPEDKAEWDKQKDEHKDEFKTANVSVYSDDLFPMVEDFKAELKKTLPAKGFTAHFDKPQLNDGVPQIFLELYIVGPFEEQSSSQGPMSTENKKIWRRVQHLIPKAGRSVVREGYTFKESNQSPIYYAGSIPGLSGDNFSVKTSVNFYLSRYGRTASDEQPKVTDDRPYDIPNDEYPGSSFTIEGLDSKGMDALAKSMDKKLPRGWETEWEDGELMIQPQDLEAEFEESNYYNWKSKYHKKMLALVKAELAHTKPKKASDLDDILARFEEGESADPTKNMSPEDKAEWDKQKDEHKDEFKKEGAINLAYVSVKTNTFDNIPQPGAVIKLPWKSRDGDLVTCCPYFAVVKKVYYSPRLTRMQELKGFLSEVILVTEYPKDLKDKNQWNKDIMAYLDGPKTIVTVLSRYSDPTVWNARHPNDEVSMDDLPEMKKILHDNGYNPFDAEQLVLEGMGPTELQQRISNDNLEGAYHIKKLATDKEAYTSYSGDPKWMKAKFPGRTKDGTIFQKGDEILYFPRTKTVMVGKEAEQAWRDFEAQAQDEDVYNQGHSAGKEASIEKQAGYRHYWKMTRDFTPEEWLDIRVQALNIFVKATRDGITVAGPAGTGKPWATSKNIAINGSLKLDEAHEAFILTRSKNDDLCKTNQKPYDAVVVSLLSAAQDIAPDAINVHSDGGPSAIKRIYAATEKEALILPVVHMTPIQRAENWLRDVFLSSDGVVPKTDMALLIRVNARVYGKELITKALKALVADAYVKLEGSDYVWPAQQDLARTAATLEAEWGDPVASGDDFTYYYDEKSKSYEVVVPRDPRLMETYFSGKPHGEVYVIPEKLWPTILRRMKSDGYSGRKSPTAPSINGHVASKTPTGLYGVSRKVQSDCEVASRRLAKHASVLAKRIYAKDEKVAEFMSTHAERGSSLPARVLMAAMSEIGPKFEKQAGLVGHHHFEEGHWYVDSNFMNLIQDVYPNSEVVHMGMGEFYLKTPDGQLEFDRMRGGNFDGQVGRSHQLHDNAHGKVVEKAIKLMDQHNKSVKVAETTLSPEDKKVIDAFIDKKKADSKKYSTDGKTLDGLWSGGKGIAEWNTPGNSIAMIDRGSKAVDTVQNYIRKNAPRNSVLASGRTYGLYGFPSRTARLGVTACADVREQAGIIASELHRRQADQHEHITGFLSRHADEGKCLYSKMLRESYPDASMKTASDHQASENWLEWEN